MSIIFTIKVLPWYCIHFWAVWKYTNCTSLKNLPFPVFLISSYIMRDSFSTILNCCFFSDILIHIQTWTLKNFTIATFFQATFTNFKTAVLYTVSLDITGLPETVSETSASKIYCFYSFFTNQCICVEIITCGECELSSTRDWHAGLISHTNKWSILP